VADLVVVEHDTVVVVQEIGTQVVEVVSAGPQGIPGPPGDASQADLFFQVANRFHEIADNEPAKQTARTNLGLSTIDGGTFF
jgi:hypothetical protein